MRLLVRFYGSDQDNTDGYALLHVTGLLLERVTHLQAKVDAFAKEEPALCEMEFWGCPVDFYERWPEKWDDWIEEVGAADSGDWHEVPPYLGPIQEAEWDLMGTEMEAYVVSPARGPYLGQVGWRAHVKHTSIVLSTPAFPAISAVRALALVGEEDERGD